ncbi:hypothetical protein [Dysgonomonas sp. 520]|uniref:hypothetical protein n=1 Tax=Dysgonomonas sp. 520 TaxID=2302931 RepID=UPI0013D343F8|nr:hypothetical protein [Dysgonomonas sp. 520]NDW09070.1 hypothetical protein [Dysgonomonas sp. 520]
MQAILIFIQKYWKQIALGFGALLLWRWVRGNGETTVKHEYSTLGATLSDSRARALADSLFAAMADMGTDVDEVMKVYNTICGNIGDVRKVYNSFGVKAYASFGSPAWSWIPSNPLSLKGWIKAELSGNDHNKWMALFTAAGIDV